MARQHGISLVLDKLLWEGPTSPDSPATTDRDSPLDVTVLFTHAAGTVLALRRAAELAHNLNARIRLVVPQVVPYPVPLTSPPVLAEFNERRFREIVSKQSMATQVEICLCRDLDDVLAQRLKPRSIVVLGSRKSWWPAADKALARKLRRQGHQVIVAYQEPGKLADLAFVGYRSA